MLDEDYALLLHDFERELLSGGRGGLLGLSPVTLRLLRDLAGSGLLTNVQAVYTSEATRGSYPALSVPVEPVTSLLSEPIDVIAVASDRDKEDLLLSAMPYIRGTPRIIVTGYAHLHFRDPLFDELKSELLVPSLANGYPNTLPHLYECLANAARLELQGVVAEFGMFKGGTTMFLSKLVERLGRSWPIIGFDTFAGFPPRRSALDMYDHPDCVFTDLAAVERYLGGRVEIVAGDIADTASRLVNESVVLSFIDTDNYSSAAAALAVVQERTLVGGAIVFDHFTGTDRFRYTLGERLAGHRLLNDKRYFHLHGTGVFYRQC